MKLKANVNDIITVTTHCGAIFEGRVMRYAEDTLELMPQLPVQNPDTFGEYASDDLRKSIDNSRTVDENEDPWVIDVGSIIAYRKISKAGHFRSRISKAVLNDELGNRVVTNYEHPEATDTTNGFYNNPFYALGDLTE